MSVIITKSYFIRSIKAFLNYCVWCVCVCDTKKFKTTIIRFHCYYNYLQLQPVTVITEYGVELPQFLNMVLNLFKLTNFCNIQNLKYVPA